MNYVSFCRMYFSVTHIPVSLMKKNEAIYSSIGEVCSVKAARYWEMAPIDDTPNFYRYSPDIEYGVVHILGTDYAIVLGPALVFRLLLKLSELICMKMPLHWNTKRQSQNFSVLSRELLTSNFPDISH
ncbi:MAG: hypothetical protein ACLUTU_09875 [Blautia faecis]